MTADNILNAERFAELADVYGGDIGRWPQDQREAARALLAADPQGLGQVLGEAAHLDRLLDLAPAGAVDAALLGRLIATAPRPAASARRWIAALGAALGLGAAAMAGVTAGVLLAGHDREDLTADALIASVVDDLEPVDAIEEPAAS
jgi:hypothetical protein